MSKMQHIHKPTGKTINVSKFYELWSWYNIYHVWYFEEDDIYTLLTAADA